MHVPFIYSCWKQCYYIAINLLCSVQDFIKVCGKDVDRLKLQSAKLQSKPARCALQLLSCLFSDEELVNGNPSGNANSKEEARIKTIQKLDPNRLCYISGMF